MSTQEFWQRCLIEHERLKHICVHVLFSSLFQISSNVQTAALNDQWPGRLVFWGHGGDFRLEHHLSSHLGQLVGHLAPVGWTTRWPNKTVPKLEGTWINMGLTCPKTGWLMAHMVLIFERCILTSLELFTVQPYWWSLSSELSLKAWPMDGLVSKLELLKGLPVPWASANPPLRMANFTRKSGQSGSTPGGTQWSDCSRSCNNWAGRPNAAAAEARWAISTFS